MGGGYSPTSGTSIATPVAAGVAALVFSARPALTGAQVESALFKGAVDLGPAGRDAYFGHGRVDAANAVAAALAFTVTADTQAPSVSVGAPLGSATVSGLTPVDVTASDNVGVTRVELRVNGTTVASDTMAPFGFSWDTSGLANGMASLVAVAFDAAGNTRSSAAVSVNVANNVVADVSAPVVTISNPLNGTRVSGNVSVKTSASDDRGSAGIVQTLLINGNQVATATGGSLAYSWNTRKIAAGTYTLQAVAIDAAGNHSVASVQVTR